MNKREQYEKKTEELLIPLLEDHGFEFVDVEFVKEGQDYYLRAYIDKEGGITIDDCEIISRELSDILDKEDYISEGYILEVSSPGLLRPLKKERDFARNLGKDIEVKTYKAVNGEKEFVGTLSSYEEGRFTIETEKGPLTFETKDTSLIRPYIEW